MTTFLEQCVHTCAVDHIERPPTKLMSSAKQQEEARATAELFLDSLNLPMLAGVFVCFY